MVFCICDKETGTIMDIVPEIKPVEDTPGQFYDVQNDIIYTEDIALYYEFEEVPKYVRIGDWKYTKEGGFDKAWDYELARNIRVNEVKRFQEMTDSMKQYDDISEMEQSLLVSILEQQQLTV